MRQRYLEVTFRRGKALAAYLYLPRQPHAKVVRTSDEGHGLKVDFDVGGAPMGIEISGPGLVGVEQLNAVLVRIGQPQLPLEEWAPLRAA